MYNLEKLTNKCFFLFVCLFFLLKECEYGDSETITIDGENYTCPDAASLFPKDWLCNALPQACCKTCS